MITLLRKFSLVLCAIFVFGLGYQAIQASTPLPPASPAAIQRATTSSEGNALLGNPTGAGTDPNNFLLTRSQYTLSYNQSHGEPNWVAWHTDSSDVGKLDRGAFHVDWSLPLAWRVTPSLYNKAGYDRGHMCPSGDRTSSRVDNDATFSMANMVPQAGDLNRCVWAHLEEYVRTLVASGDEAYQMAGPLGNIGTIGNGKVVVPAACWKVVVILPVGTGDLQRINSTARVIAVEMPNVENHAIATLDWRSCITTPSQIEGDTGLRFFTVLPTAVRSELENHVDSGK